MEGERIYVIPLRSEVNKGPRNFKASRAVNTIRRFLVKHTKAGKVNVSERINQDIWKSGRQNPPKSIKVRVKVQDGVAIAKAMDEMFIEKAKEEKKPVVDKVVSEPAIPEAAEHKHTDAQKAEHTHSHDKDGHHDHEHTEQKVVVKKAAAKKSVKKQEAEEKSS